jgi:hypothetical protein
LVSSTPATSAKVTGVLVLGLISCGFVFGINFRVFHMKKAISAKKISGP